MARQDRMESFNLILLGEEESPEFPFDEIGDIISNITFVAEGSRGEEVIRKKLPQAAIIRGDDPACIDHLKIRSDGQGYDVVIVWDSHPAAVRLALGAAAPFGEVYFCYTPRGKVNVDLHSTINYKSLRILAKC